MQETPEHPPEATVSVHLRLNGIPVTIEVSPNAILLDVLREQLGLTGTKKGCDHGQCGACTVHLDGRAINACLRLAVMCEGQAITTIEGLANEGLAAGDALHPVQQAFLDHDAFQCGYCSPGQIMSAVALLEDRRVAGDIGTVREAMSGNLCRCGAYQNILAAIQDARLRLHGQEGGDDA
ncbi:(2Fe-2S)-binding protein [Halomonas cerina]|uniref:Xanthine dehydrogenase YagT iron-sulfur-binding subunit n=1 Tax=Halomonas cerina TaxID=447424 RepID=A0A839VIA9_9GAMM|nr:(2Fe-2S)-binding protein [Halomonas cerina]MBB3192126.1 xanthine dehydrogenase YagT iron-sulfur-binding subunit [Halomonas cerina]